MPFPKILAMRWISLKTHQKAVDTNLELIYKLEKQDLLLDSTMEENVSLRAEIASLKSQQSALIGASNDFTNEVLKIVEGPL